MTGIEKAIMIILFTFTYLFMGFILLWVLSYQKDKKRDNTNANENFKNLWKQCDDLIVKYDSLNYEFKQLQEKYNELNSKKNKRRVEE